MRTYEENATCAQQIVLTHVTLQTPVHIRTENVSQDENQ